MNRKTSIAVIPASVILPKNDHTDKPKTPLTPEVAFMTAIMTPNKKIYALDQDSVHVLINNLIPGQQVTLLIRTQT
jgi:hypothetical protein